MEGFMFHLGVQRVFIFKRFVVETSGCSLLNRCVVYIPNKTSYTTKKAPKIPSEEDITAQETANVDKKKQEPSPSVTPVESPPSFVLMDIQDVNVVFYIYKLVEGEVKVEKMDFTKKLFD